MLSIVVIGTGNVARQLCQAWKDNATATVVQVIGRTHRGQQLFEGHPVTPPEAITKRADYYIIAVSDDAIESVSQVFTNINGLIVHTSGSIPIDALQNHDRTGVMYPLQTLSSGRKIDFAQVPLFLETEHEKDNNVLQKLADSLSEHSYWINSHKRRQLHVAAVYLNNFVNHLIYLSSEQCKSLDLDPALLQPLLKETIAKAMALGPYESQTGPARRGDRSVIQDHISLLQDATEREIYRIISQSIQSTYENELQKLA